MPLASRPPRPDHPAPRRGGLARTLTGLWVVLHLLLVTGAPVLDAAVGHSDSVVAHWEDSEGGDCPTSHGSDECQICQVVTKARALAAGGVATAIPETAAQQRADHAHLATPRFAFLDGHSSRAPPLG